MYVQSFVIVYATVKKKNDCSSFLKPFCFLKRESTKKQKRSPETLKGLILLMNRTKRETSQPSYHVTLLQVTFLVSKLI